MSELLREFVRSVLNEANLASLVSIGNKDNRGVIVAGQKIIVVGRGQDGRPQVDAYAGLHREDIGWRVSFLWGRDPRATVVILLACLDHYGKISVDTDMSPAAKAVVKNYYETYKDDESKVLNFYLSRGMADDMYDALFIGPTGLQLDRKKRNAENIVSAFSKESGLHPEEIEDDLFAQGSKGFNSAYNDDAKAGRLKPAAR